MRSTLAGVSRDHATPGRLPRDRERCPHLLWPADHRPERENKWLPGKPSPLLRQIVSQVARPVYPERGIADHHTSVAGFPAYCRLTGSIAQTSSRRPTTSRIALWSKPPRSSTTYPSAMVRIFSIGSLLTSKIDRTGRRDAMATPGESLSPERLYTPPLE